VSFSRPRFALPIAEIDRKAYEIQRRAREGGLDLKETSRRLQHIIENGEPYPPELPTLKSNGRTGAEWIHLLRDAGAGVRNFAEDVLTQDEFDDMHVIGSHGYSLELICGDEFNDDERTIKNIRLVGTDERGLVEPPAEVAPLLAEKLTVRYLKWFEEERGVQRLVIMHEAVIGFDGDSFLLCVERHGDVTRLNVRLGFPESHFFAEDGLIFLSRKMS